MLNLIKLNENKNKISTQENKSSKHFSSPIRIWNNSIYVYNKNVLNVIPTSSNVGLDFIRNYFNIFNKILEQKVRMKRIFLKLRRISFNKIYISNGEFKHTNNKVVITLYFLDRQKNNYLTFIKKWYINIFIKKKGLKKGEKNFEKFLFKLFESINLKSIIMFKSLNNAKLLRENKFKDKQVSLFVKNFQKKLLNKWLSKLLLYFYYKQLIFVNKSKLNYTYLRYLKKYLEIIYSKNVELNLIDIKRFYLNSDLLSQSITLKIRKNRKKMLRFINRLKEKVKIQSNRIDLSEPTTSYVNTDKNALTAYDTINIVKSLKYKHISGFRIEASGRLTKRYTASRSVKRTVYKGNLLNLDSSYIGLSTIMLKGNLESNLQFTKLSSNTRIGSFGIKGWVSGN